MLWMEFWLSRSSCTSEWEAIRGQRQGGSIELETETALQSYISMDLGEKVWSFRLYREC